MPCAGIYGPNLLLKKGKLSMTSEKTLLTAKQMSLTALMTAVICILAPWSLNLYFSPVPISLGSMAIYFVLYVLGLKLGTVSVILYILLGLVGLPVFTNFTGGAAKLLGPTGGYIVGYIFLALICGFFLEKFPGRLSLHIAGFLLGTLALYLFGTIWLKLQMNLTFPAALMAGVVPYIPFDIIKLILAIALGYPLKKRLKKAGLL